MKAVAWWLTGSAALYSDALESIVNVAAGLIALAALRFAAIPADANHPYGHDKVEFFAAVIEGVMIVVAALSIFRHAWAVWQSPHVIAQPGEGLALNAVATVLNGVWSAVLIRTGKRIRSPALLADGRHLLADVVTSIEVTIGVGLAVLTGYLVLDPILAAATGVYVLWSGMAMIWLSVGGLMDAAPQPTVVNRIRELVAESAAGALEAHDLRMRHAGKVTFLEFHLVVPGSMTVANRTRSAIASRRRCRRRCSTWWSPSTSSRRRKRSSTGCRCYEAPPPPPNTLPQGEGEGSGVSGAHGLWLCPGCPRERCACGFAQPVHRPDAGAAGA